MAVDTAAARSPAARKIRRLGIAVAVVVILYSAGWFYLASKIQSYLGGFLQQQDGSAVSLRCDDLSMGGFPFLIGFTCNRTGFDNRAADTEMTAGPFRLAARVYNPGSAIVELEGPADMRRGDGSNLSASWSRLRSSFRAGFSGLKSLSLEGEEPAARIDLMQFASAFELKASESQFHTRANNGDLDLAVLARDFEFNDSSGTPILPKLSTSADLTLIAKGQVLEGRSFGAKALKGELRSFKIETPDGLYGEMSGPFSIGDDGYLSGTFQTTFEKVDLWDRELRRIFPGADTTISGLAALLKGLANGNERVTVTLEVNDGAVSLSMLPLGRLPPI